MTIPDRSMEPWSSWLARQVSAARASLLAIGAQAVLDLTRCGADRQRVLGIRNIDDLGALDLDPASRFDLVLWQASITDFDELELRWVHHQLAERGRVILREESPGSARERAALRQRIAECGFVPLAELDHPPTGRALLIRRDRFLVRSYRGGDELAILRLFTPSFHVERSLAHWQWKFLDNPFGRQRISMAFSPQGELAAHHAGYPVPFWYRGGPWRACLQIGDLMTDPRFRRVGLGPTSLLARCARHFYAAFCSQDVGFNYGFNTDTSRAFSLRFLDAEELEPVTLWRRAVSTQASPQSSGPYRVATVSRFDAAWDDFFARVAPHYDFLVARQSSYLHWRYPQRPDVDYHFLAAYRGETLVGWSVFRREPQRLIWGDALFDPRHLDAVEAVLRAALLACGELEIDSIDAWFARRPSWWVEHLHHLGFVPLSEPHGLVLTYVPHADEQAATRLQGLYYTMGDSDLF